MMKNVFLCAIVAVSLSLFCADNALAGGGSSSGAKHAGGGNSSGGGKASGKSGGSQSGGPIVVVPPVVPPMPPPPPATMGQVSFLNPQIVGPPASTPIRVWLVPRAKFNTITATTTLAEFESLAGFGANVTDNNVEVQDAMGATAVGNYNVVAMYETSYALATPGTFVQSLYTVGSSGNSGPFSVTDGSVQQVSMNSTTTFITFTVTAL
jgi:hypothetical protein